MTIAKAQTISYVENGEVGSILHDSSANVQCKIMNFFQRQFTQIATWFENILQDRRVLVFFNHTEAHV